MASKKVVKKAKAGRRRERPYYDRTGWVGDAAFRAQVLPEQNYRTKVDGGYITLEVRDDQHTVYVLSGPCQSPAEEAKRKREIDTLISILMQMKNSLGAVQYVKRPDRH